MVIHSLVNQDYDQAKTTVSAQTNTVYLGQAGSSTLSQGTALTNYNFANNWSYMYQKRYDYLCSGTTGASQGTIQLEMAGGSVIPTYPLPAQLIPYMNAVSLNQHLDITSGMVAPIYGLPDFNAMGSTFFKLNAPTGVDNDGRYSSGCDSRSTASSFAIRTTDSGYTPSVNNNGALAMVFAICTSILEVSGGRQLRLIV